jgi:DNA-binding transcriptional LysR family regulator
MNLNHLAVFDAVAREKNISRAGQRLRISQPAVSKQLRLLEQALATRLVDRGPKGVRLTASGELLAAYAQRLFALADEADHAMAELQGLRRGRLIVGASTTIGIYFLPALLAQYHRLYPHIDLGLEVANTHVIQQYLVDHRVDVALTEGFVHWPSLSARVFLVDELVAIAPPRHPLSAKRSVSLKEFCAGPWLIREEGSGTREVIEDALHARGLNPAPLMTLGNTEAIKRAVAAGIGLAFVSALTIQQELADRRLVRIPLRDFSLHRDLHLVQRQNHAPSPALAAFLQLLPSPPTKSPRHV